MSVSKDLEKEIQCHLADIDTAQGSRKEQLLNKLEQLIYEFVIVLFHDLRRTHQEEKLVQEALNRKLIKVVQADMTSKTQLALTCLAGGLQIASCGAEFTGLFGLIAKDAGPLAGKAFMTAGQGVSAFEKGSGAFNQASIEGSRFNLEVSKQKREDDNAAASRAAQETDRLLRNLENAEQSKHQGFSSVAPAA